MNIRETCEYHSDRLLHSPSVLARALDYRMHDVSERAVFELGLLTQPLLGLLGNSDRHLDEVTRGTSDLATSLQRRVHELARCPGAPSKLGMIVDPRRKQFPNFVGSRGHLPPTFVQSLQAFAA
jgi:hypothetical protein